MKVQELFESADIAILTVEKLKEMLMKEFDELEVSISKKSAPEKEFKDSGQHYQIRLSMDADIPQIKKICEFVKRTGFSKVHPNGSETSFFPPKGSSSKIHRVNVVPDKGAVHVWIYGYDKATKFDYVGAEDQHIE